MVQNGERYSCPPAIILGGDFNALSVARSLFQAGIEVYALNYPNSRVCYSRACRRIRLKGRNPGPEAWEAFLLGQESDHLRGAIILTCSDEAIEILIRSGERLRDKFILEETSGEVRACLLDKLSTYEKATEAAIPVAGFWSVSSSADLERVKGDLRFPLLVKPRLSHKFQRIWPKRKYFKTDNFDQLRAIYPKLENNDIAVLLMEFIPGGDELGCSYYAYMTDGGVPLVEFTKRCIRRYPPNMGNEVFGFTDWIPEVRDLGRKFFQHVGFTGVGQIEFKRDERDGKFKIIESNGRFTAVNSLLAASGVDLAVLAYDKLTGSDPVIPETYTQGVNWWVPVNDFRAFVELQKQGKITFREWVSGILKPHVLPAFRWDDPLPTIVSESKRILGLLRTWFGR